jgi:hypothetical protein
MSKGYLLSILFHLAVFLLLIININFLKPHKKLTYQKISIHIGPVKKEPLTNSPKEIPEKKIIKAISEIPQKIQITESMNSKIPESKDKKEPVTKKNNEIKEKIRALPPKETPKKKMNKKELQKTNTQKLQQERKQKIPQKNTAYTKKLPDSTKKKKVEKQEPGEDIFSKLVNDSNPVNLNNTSAVLDENDDLKIKEQLQRHWNQTPCLDNMVIEVEIMIDGNCNIIYRSLKNTSISSAQLRACAESALKATQKVDKLELDVKSCKKYNQELMNINFNK